MKKLFAVTSGTYSDYRIDALFETKRDATKHSKRINNLPEHAYALEYDGGESSVEEFILYGPGEIPMSRVEFRVYCHATDWKPSGTDVSERTVFEYDHGWRQAPRVRPWDIGGWCMDDGTARAWAEASTRDAAVKAASDRLARLLAKGQGIA